MSEDDGATQARQELGRNVRQLRGERGRSQEDVAAEMQKRGHRWHQATVYKVEAGARALEVTEAAALADVLGGTVEVLLAGGADFTRVLSLRTLDDEVRGYRSEVFRSAQAMMQAQDSLRRHLNSGARRVDRSSTLRALESAIRDGLELTPEAAVAEARKRYQGS